MAIIVASREAAKSFFLNIFFSLYRNNGENDGEKKKNLENVKKKKIYSALISSPGRGAGNKIIFKDGLRTTTTTR